ncbi:MAG: phage antirepressor N-terminal domain-containing protein [Victivallaceae bacterium]|nr:phage antirepressor N-terminal domain-containing protein [Victivallaceae bacterium]
MEQTIQIDFQGDKILVVVKNGTPYVALKPISDALGLAWPRQFTSLKKNKILMEGITNLVIPSAGGVQEMVCLPLKFLNGWLFRIDINRYSGERLQKLEEYQRECYDVLNDYFMHGGAINPEATPLELKVLQARLEDYRKRFLPKTEEGTISDVSGWPRIMPVHAYFRAHPRKSADCTPDLFEGRRAQNA